MSENVVDLVEKVRAARGLPSINPFAIEDDHRPGPEPSIEQQAQARAELAKPPEIPAVPKEEMLEREEVEDPKPRLRPEVNIPEPKLLVMDGMATLDGVGVQLTEEEQAKIARVVRGARLRLLREEIRRLGPLRAKKRRKKLDAVNVRIDPVGTVSKLDVPLKRKPGRPRKIAVDGSSPAGS